MSQLRRLGFCNSENERVKTIFVPSYLNGDDGIFNMSYYDLLIGMDLTVFPSYYEPWAILHTKVLAFLSPPSLQHWQALGTWVKKMGEVPGLSDGVDVVFRDDFNHVEAAQEIAEIIYDFSLKSVRADQNFVRFRQLIFRPSRLGSFYWSLSGSILQSIA